MMIRLATLGCILALASAGMADAQTDKEIAARLTPAVHVCERSPENGGTLQQAFCYKDEAARQDQQLNNLWVKVINKSSRTNREALRQSERRWIKERDATCKEEAAGYINSTARYMFNVCMANETIRRTIWLEKAR